MRIPSLCVLLLCCSCCAQEITIQASDTIEDLRGVSALKSGVIWASGSHGTYLRSGNSGKNWTVAHVPGAETLDFRDVEAISSDTAYLLSAGSGEQSRIYKTVDGGRKWKLQFTNTDPQGFLDCMAFWDQKDGIVLGDPVAGRFVLLRTEDGGETWSRMANSALMASDGEGAFAASGTCITTRPNGDVWFATGGSVARVFHSRDAGKSWQVAKTPITQGQNSSGIFSIAFRDARNGMIAGGDYKSPQRDGANLAFTTDGGMTWTVGPVSPQWYFSAAAWNPGSDSFVAVGTTAAAFARSEHSKGWQKTWNGPVNAVSFYAAGKGVAVGPKGLIETISATP
ncbi:MAG TPA: hypothetical protein VFA89_19645 [Terriglobales bacterium]|nr:hypothetical protein [Terriglobales bacterium]